MAGFLLVLALIFFVVGPAAALLTGSLGIGALVFSAGVVLLGIKSLTEGRDRAVGWALVVIGSITALVDLVRLLLIANSV